MRIEPLVEAQFADAITLWREAGLTRAVEVQTARRIALSAAR
jgi:hypothetical protein